MATAREHYDRHLGPVYAWMLGDLDAAAAAARAHLGALGLLEGAGRRAVDLGAGPGLHAVALAEAGWSVTAVDACAPLLEVLRARGAGRGVRPVEGDLLEVRRHAAGPVDLILCLGDTLTHLAALEEVERLLEEVARSLAPGGTFVATFRDYASRTLAGAERFIPVRQDPQRILTCFLEYGERTVTVHDLLHERGPDGWALRVSSYPKLRLSPERVRGFAQRCGLVVALGPGPGGMVQIVARRPR